MSFGDTVWERTKGADELSEREYVSAVTISTVFGLLVAAFFAYSNMDWRPTSIWSVLGWGLALPMLGIVIALYSTVWQISLLGYTMIVSGLGMIMGPTVSVYETRVVVLALTATAGVTVVTSVTGIAYPNLLRGWGMYLFGG